MSTRSRQRRVKCLCSDCLWRTNSEKARAGTRLVTLLSTSSPLVPKRFTKILSKKEETIKTRMRLERVVTVMEAICGLIIIDPWGNTLQNNQVPPNHPTVPSINPKTDQWVTDCTSITSACCHSHCYQKLLWDKLLLAGEAVKTTIPIRSNSSSQPSNSGTANQIQSNSGTANQALIKSIYSITDKSHVFTQEYF